MSLYVQNSLYGQLLSEQEPSFFLGASEDNLYPYRKVLETSNLSTISQILSH
jgi:hypothetical protein